MSKKRTVLYFLEHPARRCSGSLIPTWALMVDVRYQLCVSTDLRERVGGVTSEVPKASQSLRQTPMLHFTSTCEPSHEPPNTFAANMIYTKINTTTFGDRYARRVLAQSMMLGNNRRHKRNKLFSDQDFNCLYSLFILDFFRMRYFLRLGLVGIRRLVYEYPTAGGSSNGDDGVHTPD